MDVRTFVVRSQALLKLNNRQLAELCGVSDAAVSGWRSGRKRPRAVPLLRLVDRLVLSGSIGCALETSRERRTTAVR